MPGILFNKFENSYLPEQLQEMYINKVYEPYLQGRKDLVMLDIGANIGMFSFYAHKYASKIYALEPSKEHMDILKKNMELNQIVNVFPIQKALSHQNGTQDFYHNDNVTMFSLKPEVNSRPQDKETVTTITFDKLLEEIGEKHIDFCKMDVEGAESEIFGSEGFDKVKNQIDMFLGEYHSWSSVNPQMFETFFLDRGFSFEWTNKTSATTFVAKRK